MLSIQLDKDGLREIYYKYMVNDFPKAELKPYDMIEKMRKNKECIAYGFYDEDNKETLAAYALIIDNKTDCLLLDYFAVCSSIRGRGYGSKALNKIKEIYSDSGKKLMIIEIEAIEFAANDNEKEVRKRRKSFYLKNTIEETKVFARFYDVEYQLLYLNLGTKLSDERIKEEYKRALGIFMPEAMLKKHLEFIR